MSLLKEVILFVKAGADGKRYGACPFCQGIFMVLMIKSQAGLLQFKVATVNLSKPPDEFNKAHLKRLPAIICEDSCLDNLDEIVEFLEDTFPTPSLLYDNDHALTASKDIFQKFCFFLKDVAKGSANLLTELNKLNAYMTSSEDALLCGNTFSHLDCEFLPKLHHIRIASAYLKTFHIPENLGGVWRYLKSAYEQDVFIKTCPSDQEIILHWAERPDTPNLTLEQNSKLTRGEQTYTHKTP